MIEIKRILCPTDFSNESEHALHHATMLATWYDAELVLLNVYSIAVPEIVLAAYPLPPAMPDVFNPTESRAAAHLGSDAFRSARAESGPPSTAES